MTTEILSASVGVLVAAVSSVITYVLTRKKYNVEVDHNVI